MRGCLGRPIVASLPLPSRAALPRLVPLPRRLPLETQATASQGAEGRLQGAVQHRPKQHYDGSAAAAYDEHVIVRRLQCKETESRLSCQVTSGLEINK